MQIDEQRSPPVPGASHQYRALAHLRERWTPVSPSGSARGRREHDRERIGTRPRLGFQRAGRCTGMHRAGDAGVEHTGHATNSGGTPLRRGNGPDVEDASADDRGSPQERTWTSVTRRGRWMRFMRSSSKKSAARRWVDGHLGASSPRAPLSALFTLFAPRSAAVGAPQEVRAGNAAHSRRA